MPAQQFPKTLPRHGGAARRDKQEGTHASRQVTVRAVVPAIFLNRCESCFAYGNQALFATFADHTQHAASIRRDRLRAA